MYKLIALDMDGTLLTPEGRISPRTQAAIAAARARGVTVVLASGRPLEGMTAALTELGLTGQDDYVICYNGALVQQVSEQRIIRSQLLTGSDARAIAHLACELGVNIHGFSVRQGLISPGSAPIPSTNPASSVNPSTWWTSPPCPTTSRS